MSDNIFAAKTYEHNITVENATLTFIGNEIVNRSEIENGLPYMQHNHGFAELFFCKKGELLINYGNAEHKLFEGDIVFIPSGIPHFSVIHSDNVIHNVGITLKEKSRKDNFNAYKKLRRLFDSGEPVFFRRYSPVFPEEMAWMEEISASNLLPLLAAFYTLLRLAEDYKSHIVSDSDKNIRNQKLNIVMQIENYIGGKYYENITASRLASMLYISPRQLARIVKERFGAPLHQVIMKKRVESAARLLQESNLSVEEISSVVGFVTKTCFYRAFKAEYNMTPIQYKKGMLR